MDFKENYWRQRGPLHNNRETNLFSNPKCIYTKQLSIKIQETKTGRSLAGVAQR